uniref:Predicted DNA binding protein, CopG/RHH family n=1 Tax=Candidatus Kentrum sp. DK TaxID=2126562 RepID=A0A450TEI8_9GAMM|nr:MAG: Predicted DNA binding protein, CopG/RHH family [Candidatus Kentron sp. DK]
MNKKNNSLPSIVTEFHDDEERELYGLVEGKDFLPDEIGEKRKRELEQDAQSMLGERRIGIRLPESDFVRIRKIAEQEGVTHEMLISSVLHKFVNGMVAYK